MNLRQLTGQDCDHIHWLNTGIGIHHQMVADWTRMSACAHHEGIELSIASGFRNFERQLTIWNKKFSGESPVKNQHGQIIDLAELSEINKIHAILLYSALPGTSRHHWGTDIDIYANNLLPEGQNLQLEPWEYERNGPFDKLNKWLTINATNFGFYYPYDCYRGGVAAEPWHLSYSPLSTPLIQAISIDYLVEIYLKINLLGKKTIIDNFPQIFERYIHNINHKME